MRRTWASLVAAGALVCGCGGTEPSRPAPAHHVGPLAAMHADHAVGQATLCAEDPSGAERRAVRQFTRTRCSTAAAGGIALLDWLTRLDAMPFVVGDGPAPPLKAVYADPVLRRQAPVLGALAHVLPHAATYPPMRHSPAVIDAVGRDVHAALTGDMAVGQALRQLTRDIDAILAHPGATA